MLLERKYFRFKSGGFKTLVPHYSGDCRYRQAEKKRVRRLATVI